MNFHQTNDVYYIHNNYISTYGTISQDGQTALMLARENFPPSSPVVQLFEKAVEGNIKVSLIIFQLIIIYSHLFIFKLSF